MEVASEMPAGSQHVQELDISRAWADGRVTGEMRLVDGRRITVVYRGVWSNSNGPDFSDALLSIDNELVRGAIEIHVRSSDWRRHRHHLDPLYNSVILHIVLEDDAGDSVVTQSGVALPTLELHARQTFVPLYDASRSNQVLRSLGSRTCLPTVGETDQDRIRSILRERGWSRLVEKQLRFGQDLQLLTAPEVLYRGMLDALGFSENRQPMSCIGEILPLQLLEQLSQNGREGATLALLLGVGGFLTDSTDRGKALQRNSNKDSLSGLYLSIRDEYQLESLDISSWTLNRVRPQNHPERRLASLASLIDSSNRGGLFETFLDQPLDGGNSWDQWLESARPEIGAARRRQIIVNVFAPLLAAYADVTRDQQLSQDVAEDWERLPGRVDDRVARSARRQIVGEIRFPIRLALEEQGLHDIHRNGCSQLRCFECPIAHLAVEREPWNHGS